MHVLFILNDPPYGTERTYNGLRLALNLLHKAEGTSVTTFLMADAAAAAKHGQQTPNGYYNLERMLRGILHRQGQVLLCGSCIRDDDIVEGARRSSMDELTALTVSADQVLVF
jgi:uncharacterized protein involved in oxidation of intracellular sulfur